MAKVKKVTTKAAPKKQPAAKARKAAPKKPAARATPKKSAAKPPAKKPVPAKRPAKQPAAKKLTPATIAKRAAELTDPIERAAFYEAAFAKLETPAELVRPWFETSMEIGGNREATAAKALAMATARPADTALLDAIGSQLAQHSFNNEAIDVLRLAIAAGSTSNLTELFLGYLLVRQDNAEGVPFLENCIARGNGSLARETLGRWYVKTDPSRALTLLATAYSGEEHELRALAFEALGQPDPASQESALAVLAFGDEVTARWKLAKFNLGAHDAARAYLHASRLFELVEAGGGDVAETDSYEAVIVRAYKEAGQLPQILPWLRAKTSMTESVAWHTHFGLYALNPNPDPELGIRACNFMVEHVREQDPSDARVWSVRAAGVAAKHGNSAPLEALVASGLDDDPDAWIEVGNCYMASDDYDAAGAAADRALLLDPHSGGALVMMCRLAMTMGDADMLHRVSLALLADKSAWHEGPEYLSRSFARRLDVDAALAHSTRAVQMASYCHNAWTARAEALFVAGDLPGARSCVEKSLSIRDGERGDEVLCLAAALAGDRARLDAELAYRYRHLPELPFGAYVERLRGVAAEQSAIA